NHARWAGAFISVRSQKFRFAASVLIASISSRAFTGTTPRACFSLTSTAAIQFCSFGSSILHGLQEVLKRTVESCGAVEVREVSRFIYFDQLCTRNGCLRLAGAGKHRVLRADEHECRPVDFRKSGLEIEVRDRAGTPGETLDRRRSNHLADLGGERRIGVERAAGKPAPERQLDQSAHPLLAGNGDALLPLLRRCGRRARRA